MYGELLAWPNETVCKQRFIDIFSQFDGKYLTGDGCSMTKMDIIG